MFTKNLGKSLKLTSAVAGTTLLAIGMLANGPALKPDVVVNINMSSASFPAPTGTPGALVAGKMEWNNFDVASGPPSNLIDTNGAKTTIHVAESGMTGGFYSSSDTSTVNAMLLAYPSTAATSTVTLSGLDSTGATTYKLYVYNWYYWNTRTATTSITEAGGTLPAAQTNTYTGGTATEGSTFKQGVNYVLFTGLKANAHGDIKVTVKAPYGGAAFNGLQLDAVSVPNNRR